MNKIRKLNSVCPHFGWKDDQHTSSGFPSNLNYCHLAVPIAAPRFNHQEVYCLTREHIQCPLFVNRQPMSMPDEIRVLQVDKPKPRRTLALVILFLVLVLAFWAIAGTTQSIGKNGSPTLFAATRPTLNASTVVSSSNLLATLTPIPIFTQIPVLMEVTVTTPSPIRAASKHELEALIGTDYQFIMHIVQAGETLDQLAQQYHTNVAAIETINYFQNSPGWSGTLLVIPVGFTDVTMLPSFVVYQVAEKDRGTTIEELAGSLKVSPLDLKYYNDWMNEGDRPLVGDLILVPRRRPMQ
ncbi:MAG: LysM peptidoglycan-binding domain-containing protein [Chloroflexi bacterium]|nr:LysM peptidoglycan-binding domain-containing protein [Chloroflexota bacterium]